MICIAFHTFYTVEELKARVSTSYFVRKLVKIHRLPTLKTDVTQSVHLKGGVIFGTYVILIDSYFL